MPILVDFYLPVTCYSVRRLNKRKKSAFAVKQKQAFFFISLYTLNKKFDLSLFSVDIVYVKRKTIRKIFIQKGVFSIKSTLRAKANVTLAKILALLVMTALLFNTLTVFSASMPVSAASANIPNGWYRFESILSGKFGMHVEGNSKQAGAKVVAYQANNGDNEIWYLERLPDGSYKLTSKSTGYVFEIGGYDDVRRKEGAQGNIWYWENTDNQHFYIKSTSYGYMLINKLTGMALDVYGGENARNGVKICQWGYDERDKAQLWKLIPVQSAPSTATSSPGQRGADWAIAQIGKSIDQDGAYGVQCVDLIRAYYQYLGVNVIGGNGCDYAYNTLPSGWIRIKNTPDFIPQPGDIAVWTSAVGGGYGHVAIVISGGLHEFTSVDQNWGGKAAHKVTHNYSGFWGVIRPKF